LLALLAVSLPIPEEQFLQPSTAYHTDCPIPDEYVVVAYCQGRNDHIEILAGQSAITPMLAARR
jgi:hypothetical protein